MDVKKTISSFDSFLEKKGLGFDAVIIGGAALGLLGVISRPTRDCDVLYPRIPKKVLDAARQFAVIQNSNNYFLADDWLNNGPSSLVDTLPANWKNRVQEIYSGKVISLKCLGRLDLLRSKLFALCDRGSDLADCVALDPSKEEIAEVLPWLKVQDGNPEWPAHVRNTINDLLKRLENGF